MSVPAPLAAYTLDFRFVLCDLSGLAEAEIRGAVLLRVAMLLMKYISDPRLTDLTAGDEQEEEADFPITELSAADQSELRPGAIFRWAIGYRRTRSGNKERVSCIVFRRLPAWTERELQRHRQEAEALAAALQGE